MGAGHVHFYLALEGLVPPQVGGGPETGALSLSAACGDPSPSALNGYLRPAGSFNQKPAWLRQSGPVLVEVVTVTDGDRLDWSQTRGRTAARSTRRAQAQRRRGSLSRCPDPAAARSFESGSEAAADPEDRSEHSVRHCGRLRRVRGSSHGQAVTAAALHREAVVEKYKARLPGEVGRIWAKLRPGPDDNGKRARPDDHGRSPSSGVGC